MTKITENSICGLVMPISAIDGMPETHWSEVKAILSDAIDKAGFSPNLVSDADDVGIIQKRIIQNLYDNPIVVCDVSGKNPNVMFELGIRLAFDKPTIVVKDDATAYSFDTGQIEHLMYPRDLRYAHIVQFKQTLTEKITATHKKASTDKNYTTFLKHFGEFTVAKLDKKEISGHEYIVEELKELRQTVQRLENQTSLLRPARDTNIFGIGLGENRKNALSGADLFRSLSKQGSAERNALFLDPETLETLRQDSPDEQ